jgi:hypothetical protein
MTLRTVFPHTTLELTAAERRAVLALIPARCSYQRRFAEGSQRLSGSDLKGKARRFAGQYMRSQRSVFDALDALNIAYVRVRGFRGATSVWSVAALAAHFNVN